jgi:predicted nucleotidyltransferase
MSTPDYILAANAPLPDEFLGALLAEIDGDDVVGVLLGGSYARGDATPFSDVDLARFVPDAVGPCPKRYTYRDGRLVSIATKTVAAWRTEFTRPERAIIAVPSLREARILLDKDGSLSALQWEAMAFTWAPLQVAADNFASYVVMDSAEWVHKILGALPRRDASSIAYATGKLHLNMVEVIAVQRGTLIQSQNTYFRQVEASVGEDTLWTQCHRYLTGSVSSWDAVDTTLPAAPPYVERGLAALHLYQATVALLWPILRPAHREVVEQTLLVLRQAGYAPPS